jgi:tetratricopeptide (TPR) repeat protein
MSDSASAADPLGPLADDFLQRCRRGERPALSEYAARHPELADQIRELFPALVMLEDVRPVPQTEVGAAGGPLPPLQRLGEYRIVREIGRGGMGVVYEAEQESLGRRVALKVLPPGALGDARHVERFQREARAAARLHHSNIVPIFAVGEEGGTHYYAMQYIEGQPLHEVLAELRHLRAEAGPRAGPPAETPPPAVQTPPGDGAPAAGAAPAAVARSLWQGQFRPAGGSDGAGAAHPAAPDQPARDVGSTEVPAASSSGLLSDPHRPYAKAVAHVGVQVAEALEYAAGQGVLHRDVKPSNLLLDVWGTAWLTDFGLAKATGAPDLTRPGDLLGTLRYMAPERFGGRADVRSDVYALGLTLYELLALRPAFGGHDQAELTRQITTAEVPRLDRVKPQLPRDLVTVVHKAMAREPADRYQTAGALAEDLRRFLDDRGIVARRASLPEQAWRWCRRHPTGAALVAAVLALCLLTVGGGVWLMRQQAGRRGRARQELEAALGQATELRRQGRWPEARAVLTQAENRLDDAGSDDLRRRLGQAEEDVNLAAALEQVRLTPATADGRFDYRGMAAAYARTFEQAGLDVMGDEESVAARLHASDVRPQLVMALDHWALVADALGDGRLMARLLGLARRADPDPEWGDRFREPAVWADRGRLRRLAAEAQARLAGQELGAGPPTPLLTLLAKKLGQRDREAEPLLRAAQRRHPEDFWLNYALGEALRERKPAEAVSFYRAALVNRPAVAALHYELGLALARQRQFDEAILAYRSAIELEPTVARVYGDLGWALHEQGRMEEAITACRKAIELDPKVAWAHVVLGRCSEYRGQRKEAIAEYRRAIQLEPTQFAAHYQLGKCLQAEGRLDEAIAEYRCDIQLDPNWALSHHNLGLCLQDRGRLDEAMAAYCRAIQLDPKGAAAHNQLGLCLRARGRLDEAMAAYRRAIQLDPKGAAAHFNLGLCLQDRGQLDEAIAEYRCDIQLDPKGAAAHNQLGLCLQDRGRLDEAMAAYRRAIQLDPKGAAAHNNLGWCLRARDRAEEAITEFRKATQLDAGGGLAHEGLVDALLRQGHFAEARAAARRALNRLTSDEPRRPALRRHLEQAERLLALDARLPALLQGEERSAAEQLELARLCRDHGRPYAAARLYAAAFATRPALADDQASRNRYDAACAAARAAADPGPDGGRPDEAERAGLRRQALDWLRADLALRAKPRPDHASVTEALAPWQTDAALASVRDRAPLEQLPADERAAWQRLWADVAALRAGDPLEQGRAHAARRDWARAAGCYARALKLNPTDKGHFWFEYAAVLLLSGDRPGYARACARLVERCDKAPELRAYHVARACTLAPDAVADAALPGRLARKELSGQAGEFWSLTEQGALHYRAGRFQEAVPLLEQSLRAEPNPGRAVLNWLWLALADQRLGKAAEARRWLGKAQAWLDRYGDGMPSRAEEELGLHLHNWLEAHVLRREAEALLGAGPAKPE